ncbi:MAG TPA: OmpA family protein [Burkholderiales bacterium]|jgi:outer membrane protein OmpA-like peptidoglycan-associated protein|nr:OmpA family protein [Burkholderiales bacterium]
MQRRSNRLLMLLISAAIAGCASQTERSSSGGGQDAVEYERVGGTTNVVTQEELERRAAAKAQAEAAAAAPAEPPKPEYEPRREDVQYIDRALEEAPPAKAEAPAPAPAPAPSAADEPLPDFPITKYEIEDAPAQEAAADSNEEMEDLGGQEDESVASENAAEDGVAAQSNISEPTVYPDEPEQAAEEAHEVEDLGTQADESGTVSHPEDNLAQAGRGISEPTVYPDEPAKPLAVSVSFEAEPLFSFDKHAVRSDQQKALDDFVASLRGVDYAEISAIGHTDRIGTEAYNQTLSEKRASAVKDYLVSRGVPAGKIRTEGRGKSEPVTGDDCRKGTRKAIIACLQPDRRVDVSVTGSKTN